jgi:hypothetical protein
MMLSRQFSIAMSCCAAVVALTVGCASAAPHTATPRPTSNRRPNCTLSKDDSLYTIRAPLYRDCAVDQPARLVTSNVEPDFRVAGTPQACYVAHMEVVVAADGTPEEPTIRVLRANDPQFADAVRTMIPRLRWQPAVRDGVPVRQVVEVTRSAEVRGMVMGTGAGAATAIPASTVGTQQASPTLTPKC